MIGVSACGGRLIIRQLIETRQARPAAAVVPPTAPDAAAAAVAAAAPVRHAAPAAARTPAIAVAASFPNPQMVKRERESNEVGGKYRY